MLWKVDDFLLAILTLPLASTIPDTGPIDYDKICIHTEWWSSPACLPDKSGYYRVYCSSFVDWESGGWVWDQDTRKEVTQCDNNKVCECKTKWCERDAMCHEKGLLHPTFPKTGLLVYTGTTDGKVAMDALGRWYHEYSQYRNPEGWERVFDLILPFYYNDAFIQYSGRVGNRTCTRTPINTKTNDRKLVEIYDSPERYRKIFEGEEGGRYVQKWQLKNFNLDPWWEVYDTATYTYLYDNQTNTAVPYKYHHYHKFEYSERTEVRTYTYTPDIDDRVFDVVRYCDGIWLYTRNLRTPLEP